MARRAGQTAAEVPGEMTENVAKLPRSAYPAGAVRSRRNPCLHLARFSAKCGVDDRTNSGLYCLAGAVPPRDGRRAPDPFAKISCALIAVKAICGLLSRDRGREHRPSPPHPPRIAAAAR